MARFPARQSGGAAQAFTPLSGGTLAAPFGIAADLGRAACTSPARTAGTSRASPPTARSSSTPTGGEPFDIVAGSDGDLYFTDQQSTRVRRLISSAPRVSASAGTATATTSANVSATVDARGNTTAVVFEYGLTSSYGTTVTTQATGVGPTAVGATLTGLTPGTTYHLRVRATNEEGEAPTADSTFATPVAPPPPPTVVTLQGARELQLGLHRLAHRALAHPDHVLSGGETIRITCKGGKGCPLKSKTYKNVKKGTRTLTSLFGKKRKLRKGAKIEIRITKPGAIGSTTTVTIGKRKKDPKIVRKQLKPA